MSEEIERLPKPHQLRIKWDRDEFGRPWLSVMARFDVGWRNVSMLRDGEPLKASTLLEHMQSAVALGLSSADTPAPSVRLLTYKDVLAGADE